MVLSKRKEAQTNKETTYFTGLPCKHGHIDFRYTVDGKCAECSRLSAKKLYHTYNGKEKQRTKERNEIKNNWRRNNKDVVNSWTAKRNANKLQRTPSWLTKEHLEEIKEFYVMAKELEDVFPWKQNVDHIVPLQGTTVSGLHVPWNLQILSAKANIEKGNRHNG